MKRSARIIRKPIKTAVPIFIEELLEFVEEPEG